MESPDESSLRAPLRRRLAAIILDYFLISVTIGLIGIVLANTTDGKVRVSNAFLSVSDCTSGGSEPLDLKLPADFHVTNVVRCTRSFLGVPHDWSLTVGEVARPEPSPTVRRYRTWSMTFGSVFGPGSSPKFERSRTVPLDPAGHITKAYYLDALTVPVLAAYILLLEWRFGFTVGKRILDLRVRALGGGPLTFAQASKRIGMRMVPFLVPSALVYKIPVPFEATEFQPVTIDVDLAGASGLLMVVFLVNFIRAVHRKALPWHDRWAGTEVVRARRGVAPGP